MCGFYGDDRLWRVHLSSSGNFKVGYAAIFHVENWVILKPCAPKNGQTYLRDPTAPPIQIIVLPPRDPRLKSAAANESTRECLFQKALSQLALKPRSGAGPLSSLPREGYLLLAPPTDRKEFVWGIDLERAASHARVANGRPRKS